MKVFIKKDNTGAADGICFGLHATTVYEKDMQKGKEHGQVGAVLCRKQFAVRLERSG